MKENVREEENEREEEEKEECPVLGGIQAECDF